MATAGQTTPTGGRSFPVYATQGTMRRVSIPVRFQINFIGVWCHESAVAGQHNMLAALYGTDGTLLAQSPMLMSPITSTTTPELVEVTFSSGATTFPAGDYDLAVSAGPGDATFVAVNGQNGTSGTPVSISRHPEGIYPDFPVSNVGLVDNVAPRAWDMFIDYTEIGPIPEIDDLNGNGQLSAGQVGNVLTGINLEAASVTLVQGAVSVPQAVTATSASEVIFDTVFAAGPGPHLKYGLAQLVAETVEGSSSPHTVVIRPAVGGAYVDLGAPHATAANRITAVADLSAGDQLEISNVVGGTIADVSVQADGTFDCAQDVTAFDVRVWDAGDATWGNAGTQTIT